MILEEEHDNGNVIIILAYDTSLSVWQAAREDNSINKELSRMENIYFYLIVDNSPSHFRI